MMTKEIPYTAGSQLRVLFSGACGGFARACIENPIEYVKVKGQTNQTWLFKDVYTGFTPMIIRNVGMATVFFFLLD